MIIYFTEGDGGKLYHLNVHTIYFPSKTEWYIRYDEVNKKFQYAPKPVLEVTENSDSPTTNKLP